MRFAFRNITNVKDWRVRGIVYEWILFDADGTLFDYDRAERFALERAFIKLNLYFENKYFEYYNDINAKIWKELEKGNITADELRTARFNLLFDRIKINFDSGIFSDVYLEILSRADFLIKGAEEIISELYGKYRLAIITNGLKDVQYPRFNRSPIREYFREIIISEEAGASKPNNEIFNYAFRKMKHQNRKSVLIVGDSLTSDIKGGISFGIDTCWYNPFNIMNDNHLKPKYEIRNLLDLREILIHDVLQ